MKVKVKTIIILIKEGVLFKTNNLEMVKKLKEQGWKIKESELGELL